MIQNRTGTAVVAPAFFCAFQNIEQNVRHQLQKLRTHPWIPQKVAVRGFVYDVTTSLLHEIKDAWTLFCARRRLAFHPLGPVTHKPGKFGTRRVFVREGDPQALDNALRQVHLFWVILNYLYISERNTKSNLPGDPSSLW